MSKINPSIFVAHDMATRPTGDADLPIADPNLFSVDDNKRVPDHMHGVVAKKKKPAARPAPSPAADGDGAGLAFLGFAGLLVGGIFLGKKYR